MPSKGQLNQPQLKSMLAVLSTRKDAKLERKENFPSFNIK